VKDFQMYLKTKEEIEKIRQSGQILARVAKQILELAKPGVKLKYLDRIAYNLITKEGAQPAFLNYHPYGALKPYANSICASVNATIVHGVPKEYKLREGDIVKIDFGVKHRGYYSDAAWTVAVGAVSPLAEKLIKTTRAALLRGIQACQPGKFLGDIGYAINKYVRSKGFKVIRDLTGHGIGKDLHEEPIVFNAGSKGKGLKLEPGLVIAIEPMVSAGSDEIVQLLDDSYATKDGSLSAHFEHTVAITETGPEILTGN